jgi:two-component system, chemotaxis family, chemotaxis protein CheY
MKNLLKTALLVDDSDTMRTLLRNFLRNFGCTTCVEVISSDEAQMTLIKFLEMKCPLPDIVFLDQCMPGSSTGMDCLKFIRSHPQLKDLPVVFATSEGESERIVEAINLGANAYIVKPFREAALERALKRIFESNSVTKMS